MLSPVEVNTMIGEVTLRTSNVTPSCECNWLRVNLSPMKKVVHQVLQLVAVQLNEIAPPLLELEVALPVRVDLGVDLILFAPKPVCRAQNVEVQNQPGPIEDSVSEVAGQGGEPAAAEKTAEIAHRILPVHALPVDIGEPTTRQGPNKSGRNMATISVW